MRFRISLAAVVCALSACGTKKDPIEITIPTLPGDKTELVMFDSRPGLWWNYRVHWKSRADKEVRLQARLVEPVPTGMSVVLKAKGTTTAKGEPILRIGSDGTVTLVVVVPEALGPFAGTVELHSDDLPGWAKAYPFRGEIVDKPRKGRYIQARPSGINLGKVRPAEQKTFVATLKNIGDQDITVKDWIVSNEEIVKVRGLRSNQVIVPGAELQLGGVVLVPQLAVKLHEKVRVVTDATNYPEGVDITIVAEVVPDFGANPRMLNVRADFPMRETEYALEIRGREGTEPFVVAKVSGHEPFFTVGELGKEAAHKQRVVLKLRRDAPADVRNKHTFRVLFRLEPQGIDVAWPVEIRLLPPVYPTPAQFQFGKLSVRRPRSIECMLQTFANRQFEVKGVTTENNRFQVGGLAGGAGLPWRFFVSPARGVGLGQHRDVIIVKTDDPDVPEIRIPAYVELVDTPPR